MSLLLDVAGLPSSTKILKAKKTLVSYLSAESNRLAFGEKVANLEKVQGKITELRKLRNATTTRKTNGDIQSTNFLL